MSAGDGNIERGSRCRERNGQGVRPEIASGESVVLVRAEPGHACKIIVEDGRECKGKIGGEIAPLKLEVELLEHVSVEGVVLVELDHVRCGKRRWRLGACAWDQAENRDNYPRQQNDANRLQLRL